MRTYLPWMLWNLFLAVIPVWLGYLTASVARLLKSRGSRRLWFGVAPLLLLWLIFLPNSCYLFTELRHVIHSIEAHQLWSRARTDRAAALHLALLAGMALVYTTAGALTFGLSIRPVKQLGRMAGLSPARWAAPFFILVSLGVYLGLKVRYNSWDLFTHPGKVLSTVANVADRPHLMGVIILSGLCLWLVYEVSDIWLDGFVARWRRWTRRPRTATPDDLAPYAGQS